MSSPPPAADDPHLPGEEPPDDELLAGELVLGVLPAAERRGAQARADADPRFAARIASWERRLAPWLGEYQPVTAPPNVWPLICQRLGWQEAAAAPAGLWRSLALWRAAAALAALAAVALWLARAPAPPPPVAAVPPVSGRPAAPVTTLARADGSPGWLAAIDPAAGTVLIVPVPSAPDVQGRVPELWVIAAGKPPRSLGLVSNDQSYTVAVPSDARAALVPGSVLAITLEPASGVPHAAPSGPIIAKGAIQT